MGKKCRIQLQDGTILRGKLLLAKKADRFVQRGEARWIRRSGKGSHLIEFTDPRAEAEFLSQRAETQHQRTAEKQVRKAAAEKREAEILAAGGWEAWAKQRYGYVPKTHPGRGWDHAHGMSRNAVAAYQEGKVPISRVTRALLDDFGINLTVKAAREALLAAGPCEWHHSSKHANKTDFYDLNALVENLKGEKP